MAFACDKSVIAVATGILEVFLLVHGLGVLSSVEYVLYEDLGYFANTTKEERSTLYTRLYTESSIVLNLWKIVVGIVIDTKGCWIARTLTTITSTGGLVAILAATPGTQWLVWLGYPMFYGTSIGFIFTHLVLMRIYPEKRAVLMALMGAANNACFLIYVIYKEYIQNWLFVGLLCLQPLTLVRTFLLTPKSNNAISVDRYDETKTKKVRLGWETRNDPFVLTRDQNTESSTPTNKLSDSLKVIFKYENCLAYCWGFIGYMRLASLLSTQEAWLGWASGYDSDEVSKYTDVWLYCNLSGIIIQPICGIILDAVTKWVSRKYGVDNNIAAVKLSPWSMTVCTAMWMLLSVLCTIKAVGAVTWVIYLLYVVQRLWVSVVNLYILSNNPESYHGRLFGVMSLVAIFSSFIMPPLTELTEKSLDGNYGTMNWIIFGLSAGSLVFPVLVYVKNRSRKI